MTLLRPDDDDVSNDIDNDLIFSREKAFGAKAKPDMKKAEFDFGDLNPVLFHL